MMLLGGFVGLACLAVWAVWIDSRTDDARRRDAERRGREYDRTHPHRFAWDSEQSDDCADCGMSIGNSIHDVPRGGSEHG